MEPEVKTEPLKAWKSSEQFPDVQENSVMLGSVLTRFVDDFAKVATIIPDEEIKTREHLTEQDFREAKAYFMEVLNLVSQRESGKDYLLDEQSKEATAKAFYYLSGQKDQCDKMGIDLRKGFLLVGNPGSGKSMLGRVMKYCGDHYHDRRVFMQFAHVTCKRISLDYKGDSKEQGGVAKISQYTKYHGKETPPIYFEDIGKEDKVGHFEKPKELMNDIIELRYDLFIKYGLKTLGDTNQSILSKPDQPSDVATRYGDHIEGRMRQMMNIVGLGANADYFDRRKLL